jgi:hypothetical protein
MIACSIGGSEDRNFNGDFESPPIRDILSNSRIAPIREPGDDFGFDFFNLGVWGKPSRLMRTDIPRLSSYHTEENKSFTNLFLAKRKGDVRQSEFRGGHKEPRKASATAGK